MKYQKDQSTLRSLVIEEAINLKTHTTDEEKKSLNFHFLDEDSSYNCLYGQMTGNCFSKRASELITKCATKVYKSNISNFSLMQGAELNGKPELIIGRVRRDKYFSPIEIFLVEENKSKNVERLFDFIQGKSEKLIFSDNEN